MMRIISPVLTLILCLLATLPARADTDPRPAPLIGVLGYEFNAHLTPDPYLLQAWKSIVPKVADAVTGTGMYRVYDAEKFHLAADTAGLNIDNWGVKERSDLVALTNVRYVLVGAVIGGGYEDAADRKETGTWNVRAFVAVRHTLFDIVTGKVYRTGVFTSTVTYSTPQRGTLLQGAYERAIEETAVLFCKAPVTGSEGVVESVDTEHATITLGKKDGITDENDFTFLRSTPVLQNNGLPMLDPITKKAMTVRDPVQAIVAGKKTVVIGRVVTLMESTVLIQAGYYAANGGFYPSSDCLCAIRRGDTAVSAAGPQG